MPSASKNETILLLIGWGFCGKNFQKNVGLGNSGKRIKTISKKKK